MISALLALQRTTHLTLHALTARLTDLRLTPAEINALGVLADGRERTVSELAADAGSRPTTLTSVLDRLEGRGLLVRGPRPGNRRVVVLTLTPAGEATASRIQQAMTDFEYGALAALPDEAVAAFHTVLAALADAT
ncbi:MarR family winged helix-turn-helix transcriptional regulator [Actinoplanes sp. NPDC051513]|uniref:MarR family winged helix-turn-helix transcriptional regulator n=1 Tax=Actinoplanes sp. NPDC051513 TaxID=3363908 RepID=UPI0037AD37D9